MKRDMDLVRALLQAVEDETKFSGATQGAIEHNLVLLIDAGYLAHLGMVGIMHQRPTDFRLTWAGCGRAPARGVARR